MSFAGSKVLFRCKFGREISLGRLHFINSQKSMPLLPTLDHASFRRLLLKMVFRLGCLYYATIRGYCNSLIFSFWKRAALVLFELLINVVEILYRSFLIPFLLKLEPQQHDTASCFFFPFFLVEKFHHPFL